METGRRRRRERAMSRPARRADAMAGGAEVIGRRVVTPVAARPTEPIRTAGRRPRGNGRAYGSGAQRRGGGLAADDGTTSPGGPRRVQRRGHVATIASWPASPTGCAATACSPKTSSRSPTPRVWPHWRRGRVEDLLPYLMRTVANEAYARHRRRRLERATVPPPPPVAGLVRGPRRRSRRALVGARPPPDPATRRARAPHRRGPVRRGDRRHARHPTGHREVAAVPGSRRAPCDRGARSCLTSRPACATQ